MMNKSLISIVRVLHRDVGFFMIGLMMIYCLSEVSLTYRDISYEPSAVLSLLNHLHKLVSSNSLHWVAWLYAGLLLFLALSSFWMYNPESALFKRGLIVTGLSVGFAAPLLAFVG